MRRLLFVVTCIALHQLGFGQDFTGTIQYEMTYESKTDEGLGMMAMMMPNKETLYISGNYAKVIQESNLTKNIFIKDLEKDTTLVYFEVMGQKLQLLLSQDQIKKQFTPFMAKSIEYSSGKKLICKQVCKRALIKLDDSIPPCEVYYLPNVKNSAYPMFGDLSGLPISFKIDEEKFVMQKTATAIEKKELSQADFAPLEGYQTKTPAELQSMMGGFGIK